jgi:hypothetical protein
LVVEKDVTHFLFLVVDQGMLVRRTSRDLRRREKSLREAVKTIAACHLSPSPMSALCTFVVFRKGRVSNDYKRGSRSERGTTETLPQHLENLSQTLC